MNALRAMCFLPKNLILNGNHLNDCASEIKLSQTAIYCNDCIIEAGGKMASNHSEKAQTIIRKHLGYLFDLPIKPKTK